VQAKVSGKLSLCREKCLGSGILAGLGPVFLERRPRWSSRRPSKQVLCILAGAGTVRWWRRGLGLNHYRVRRGRPLVQAREGSPSAHGHLPWLPTAPILPTVRTRECDGPLRPSAPLHRRLPCPRTHSSKVPHGRLQQTTVYHGTAPKRRFPSCRRLVGAACGIPLAVSRQPVVKPRGARNSGVPGRHDCHDRVHGMNS
jgi:hypothetical protein